MGEKEERGIVNITKRSKDDDDDYGSAGSWQERREPGQLHLELLHHFVLRGGGSSTTDFVTQVGRAASPFRFEGGRELNYRFCHPGWRSPALL